MPEISVFQSPGMRKEQEDSFWIEQYGPRGFIAAVADGFEKPGSEEGASGRFVSKRVIQVVQNEISGREPAAVNFFQHLDRQIYRATENFLGGSTLALAYQSALDDEIICMARGNSVIVSKPFGSSNFEICPKRFFTSESDMWSCYGDRDNSKSHEEPAEICHLKYPEMLIVASDGVFPPEKRASRRDHSLRGLYIRNVLFQYIDAASRRGASVQNLAFTARDSFENVDNLTVILVKTSDRRIPL